MNAENLNQNEHGPNVPDIGPEIEDMTNLDRALLAEAIEHLEPEKKLVAKIMEAYRKEFAEMGRLKRGAIHWESNELFTLKNGILMIETDVMWMKSYQPVPDEKNNDEPTTISAMISGIQAKTGATLTTEMIQPLIDICNQNVALMKSIDTPITSSNVSVSDDKLQAFSPAVKHD